MTASETTQARQAALLLHGLQPAARRRVIAKLSGVEVARLEQLLKELEQLGVSQSLGQHLRHLASLPPASAPTARDLTVQEQVRALSADVVVQCLKSCAPATVAQLLRADAWPWQQQALERMSELRRAEVRRHMRSESAVLAPAVLAALCQRMCLEAARLHVDRSQASGSSTDRLDADKRRVEPSSIRQSLRRLIRWMR